MENVILGIGVVWAIVIGKQFQGLLAHRRLGCQGKELRTRTRTIPAREAIFTEAAGWL